MTGEVISWKSKSGVINKKQTLRFPARSNPVVSTFSLINLSGQTYGLVTWRAERSNVQIGIFDLSNGFPQEINLPVELG